MITVDLQSRTPIYEQLCGKISELIYRGVLKPNEQLPSVRALAKELGINPNTVAKTYQELERNNMIYSLSGRGSFVAEADIEEAKSRALESFDAAVKEAMSFGAAKEELIKRIPED